MSERDRQVESRLQAAFDRFNRSVIGGQEPTPALFLEALHDEGLQLSLAGSPAEAIDAGAPSDSSRRATVAGRAQRLLPGRARGS